MEVEFTREVEQLKLGAGATFEGEGILAITKALLESGVAYVGGYQGAPVSHLLDVMVQAKPYLDELGVHVEPCANEASAAAMLGASIHYPLRGAVTWKSIVGTNVAADALSNLASPGVIGGALVIVGEDYGEGASRHPGADARLCAEVDAAAARSASGPSDDGPHGRARLPDVGSDEHAGDPRASHPRLPRARPLRLPRQPAAGRLDARAARRAGAVRLRAARRTRRSRSSTRSGRSTSAFPRPAATSSSMR